jgi:hypothetical protein
MALFDFFFVGEQYYYTECSDKRIYFYTFIKYCKYDFSIIIFLFLPLL